MKAVQKAYETVRQAIIEGRYGSGSRITEQEVAAQAGVSRTPVREALRRLQAEGLLHFVPNQGAVVAVWTDEEIDDIFELRAMLEAYAAERATERATPEAVARLRELAERQLSVARLRRPGYLEEVGALNSRFHTQLQEAAASERLQSMLVSLVEVPLVMQTFRQYSHDQLVRSSQHHVEIVLAMEAKDAGGAGSIMRAHVLAARRAFHRIGGDDGSRPPLRKEAG